MKHIQFSFILCFACWLLLLVSCNTGTTKNNEATEEDKVNVDSEGIELDIQNTIFSIPSPQQTNIILKENKLAFNRELLNSPDNLQKYYSTIRMSLNIGIYGVDMGYLNMYNETTEIPAYYNAILKLTDELELTGALDKTMQNRVKNNASNNDSILSILIDSYSSIDRYLRMNKRELAGILILAGGWIESFYLATQIMIDDPKPNLIEHVEYQKYPLEKIIKLLSPYYDQSQELNDLTNQLTDLAYEFDCIDVSFTVDSVVTDTANSRTDIANKVVIEHNNYNLNKLASQIALIRNSIVK